MFGEGEDGEERGWKEEGKIGVESIVWSDEVRRGGEDGMSLRAHKFLSVH